MTNIESELTATTFCCNLLTYNCNSLNEIRIDYLNKLLEECKPTFVFLQYAFLGVSGINIHFICMADLMAV